MDSKVSSQDSLENILSSITVPLLILPHLQHNLSTASSDNYCPIFQTASPPCDISRLKRLTRNKFDPHPDFHLFPFVSSLKMAG